MSSAAEKRRENVDTAREYASALVSSAAHPSDARVVIDRALDAGFTPLRIVVDVIPEALYEVGRLWERGEITVAVEHLATAATQDVLRELARRVPSTTKIGKTVIVAATEGERHELGPRVVADLLIADGWEVLYVGAATPPGALALLARERHPDAVVLSATLRTQLGALEQAVRHVRAEAVSSPFILVGGQATAGVQDVAAKIGADAAGLRADMASEVLRGAMTRRNNSAAAESLTRREEDVLALLAAGQTNQEIAQRLTMSVPTVKSHVQHILRKLELRNRSEVAAFGSHLSSQKGHATRSPQRD